MVSSSCTRARRAATSAGGLEAVEVWPVGEAEEMVEVEMVLKVL